MASIRYGITQNNLGYTLHSNGILIRCQLQQASKQAASLCYKINKTDQRTSYEKGQLKPL